MAEEGKQRYCDQVAETVIQKMKDGTAPWVRPWAAGETPPRPVNASTGKAYRGLNSLWLTMCQPDDDPRWCTLKQANRLGGKVVKGSRSTTIRYWAYTDRRPKRDENGNYALDGEGKRQYVVVQLERPKVFHARVFHASQIEGLPELERPAPKAPEWDPCGEAEKILQASGANIKHDQSDRAFYRPVTDSIHLPQRAQFAEARDYYGTALHELGHWTGHESRLDRELVRCDFGSEEYAREELRAEIASYMLGTELGVGHDASMTAAYLTSWIKALEEDPGEIYRAARDADKIRDHIMGLTREQEKVVDGVAGRTYLAVPDRSDNKEVKALGGKWDRKNRQWYVPEGVDPEPFSEWSEELAYERNEDWEQDQRSYSMLEDQKGRVYLDVPDRADNDEVKALGGKWDRKERSWYVQNCENLPALRKWIPERALAGERRVDRRVDLVVDDRADNKEVKALGAKWDRKERTWYAPAGVDLGPLGKWIDLGRAEPDPASERAYLDVPDRADNDEVRALGGKWDRKARSWYAPPGTDLSGFAKWLPERRARGEAAELSADAGAAAGGESGKATWLRVPFAEKEEAKALGARWNRSARKWYAPLGVDVGPLQKWMPTPETERGARETAEEQFAGFLAGMGLVVEGPPVMDGEAHRVPVLGGKPGSTDGMYVGHLDDSPAGYVKNWKTGQEETWKGDGREMSREEAARARRDAERSRQEREERRQEEHEETAEVMRDLFFGGGGAGSPLAPAPSDHPYLQSKGLEGAVGLQGADEEGAFGARVEGDKLILPLVDVDGKVWSAHSIGPNGFKSFAKGGRVGGCFHSIGDVHDQEEVEEGRPILITSGFGTGAVIAAATKRAVVCALSDWNLMAVAQGLHEKYPERDIVVLGDDDRHLPAKGLPNSGREKAQAAAAAVGGVAVLPKFDELLPPEDHTDFADLAAAAEREGRAPGRGLEAVRNQVVFGMRRALEERDLAAREAPKAQERGAGQNARGGRWTRWRTRAKGRVTPKAGEAAGRRQPLKGRM